jgi:fucose permease
MVTKTSILIFYLRLSRNTVKLLRIASYVTLVVVNIAGIVLTFLNVFQCKPVSAVFDGSGSSAQCIPLVTLYLASAPVNIITDLAILVLPIPVLTGMRLPQKQKTILVVTFALGIFVAVVDVVRIYYLQQASVDVNGSLSGAGTIGGQTDFAWYASLSLMWSAVEVNIGIICACIPTLKPLITRILPKLILDHTLHSSNKSVSFTSPADLATENDAPQNFPSPPEATTQPLPHVSEGGNQEQEMGMMDFLTTPGMNQSNKEQEMGMMDFLTTPGMDPSHIQKAQTHQTRATENSVYFGFVNMRRPRSMLETRGMESFKYCTVVTILFFLWGFSYGLLNTLNTQISAMSHSNSQQQSLGLQSAYFGAYLVGPLAIGQWVLKRGGFKSCFITGLCIYGTGTLMFWPSAVLVSFPGFVVSNFVVGFGLSVLETAANPFLALCGPSDYGEMRLLTAQGVQAVGSVVSPLLAQEVLFKNLTGTPSLIDVQWTYLAIALFDVILALFFYYMPLPEASDEDLHLQSQSKIPQHNNMITPVPQTHLRKYRIIYITLAIGITAQFLYVGVQESISVYLESLISSLDPDQSSLSLSTFNYDLLGRATFAIGRFLAALLCLFLRPRLILLLSFLAALIFSILVFALPEPTGPGANTIASVALLVLFFEGPMWPIIFAISLRKMGHATKSAAAFLTAAASGGAVFPWVMFAVQSKGMGVQYSFCIAIALFTAGLLFPVYLSAVPAARAQVDPVWKGEQRMRENEGGVNDDHADRPQTPIQRLSRAFTGVMAKLKDSHERESVDGELPTVEHRERRSWGSKSEK